MELFGTSKKEKTVLDLFTYDLTSFFYGNYEEVDSEETEATFMIVYEKELPWSELKIFDYVQFRVFYDKETITGSNPINVRFICKNKTVTLEHIQYVVDQMFQVCGMDDLGAGEWIESDVKSCENKSFKRVWTLARGESFTSVYYDTDGLVLNILFFNNLLKFYGKFLDIKH